VPPNRRVIAGCRHGEEDPRPRGGLIPHHGKQVVMWLTREGVRLALRGYVDPIRAELDPPVKRVHDQLLEKGGRFFVCPICFGERDLDAGELVENAELKGATPPMEFAGEGAMTFTY
jgi:uncharacterized protein